MTVFLRVRFAIVQVASLAMVLVWPAIAGAQPPYSGIVTMGTSLSDSGNAFALLGSASTPPDYSVDPFLIPDRPYARGGHHFSDGPTWVEQLARSMALAGSARPAFRSNGVASNYAVGGARAREVGSGVNLGAQVGRFLQETAGSAPSDALYAVEIGANDVRDALALFAAGGDGGPILADALAAIGQQILQLYAAGARKFVVLNVPNLALVPAIRPLGPAFGAFATGLTQTFNLKLETEVLTPLSPLPGIGIKRVDLFATINAVVANPAAFGLTNTNSACITPGVAPFVCRGPEDYLFWDGIHPTSAGHAIIAHAATLALSN